MAGKSELDIIAQTTCPTCGAKPGKPCVTVRGITNQPTSIHPRRRALVPKRRRGTDRSMTQEQV